MNIQITQNIKAIILGLVVTVGVGYAGAAWNPAPSTGPQNAATNNAPAPINIGSLFQTKLGGIGMTDLIVSNSFQFASGTPSAGKVLTALDSAGNVGWGSAGNGSVLIESSPSLSYITFSDTAMTTVTLANTTAKAAIINIAWGEYLTDKVCARDVLFNIYNNNVLTQSGGIRTSSANTSDGAETYIIPISNGQFKIKAVTPTSCTAQMIVVGYIN